MKQSFYTTAAIALVTAVIGIVLWANGFPPEKEGLSETSLQVRAVVTFPLFWAGFCLVTTLPLIWFKRGRLTAPAGKASRIPAFSVQLPALAGLLFQILIPLDVYDIVGTAGTHTIFFYFIAAAFFLMGNYIATAPFGSKIGFRNKATLSDQTVWARTHRFLGRSLVLTTLVALPLPFIIDGQIAQWALIGLIMVMKAIAWLHARQLAARQTLRSAVTN